MKTSNKGRKLIEKFEGLILRAYDDYNDKIVKPGEKVRGTLTIGYGHTTRLAHQRFMGTSNNDNFFIELIAGASRP
jgi:GH24 family phage-related lysozyme (muramidase)